MRELTRDERDSLYDRGECPFCRGKDFYEGPSGGMSTNWYCANDECGAGFNLTPLKDMSAQVIKEPMRV